MADPDFVPSTSEPEDEDQQPDLSELNHRRRRNLEAEEPVLVLPLIAQKFKHYFDCLKTISNGTLDAIHHIPCLKTPRSSTRFQDCVNLDQIHWTSSRPWKISQNGEDFYQSVKIQNQTINIGSVIICERKTGREFSYRKARLTTVDDNYGSDTDDEREDKFQDIKPPKPNRRRFLIRALFERNQLKYFHGTWLEEAQHSFVGASGEPLELLLVDQCYEIELRFITGIEKVVWIAANKTEPPPIDSYYCRFHWKPNEGSFLDLPCVRKPNPPNPIKHPKSLCSTCVSVPREIEWLTDATNGHILLGKTDQYELLGFTLRGQETYRLNDFVRVADTSPSKPQVIGQIVEICGVRANWNADKTINLDDTPFRPPAKVYSRIASLKHKPVITIRKYQRKPWFQTEKDSRKFADDHRLWMTNQEQLVDVKSQLEGKCEIVHLFKDKTRQFVTVGSRREVSEESIINRDNCFYSILPTRKQAKYFCSVPIIDDGWEKAIISQEPEWVKIEHESSKGNQYADLVKNYGCGRIRHLELFGGIGSMSVALIELGLASQDETMFIDFSIPACQTLSTNFPRSTIICADVNEVLALMINGKTESGQDFLVDQRTGKVIRVNELPRPGDFDLITAGFPCGSHSTLNVLRKANDSKNALCATALSFIAYLKPDYLFFENVWCAGLLKTSFINPGNDSVLNKAFLRIINGALISLGYQVQFGVLQAAQFGSPQARRRIIFAGTRHGLTAIKLPEPTHHYPDEGLAILLPTNDEKSDHNGHRLVRADYRKCSSGALKAITVHDAISDLPEFEYLNPDRIMAEYCSRRPHRIRQNNDNQELITGRSELVPQLNRLVSFSSTLNHSTISLIGFDEFEYLTKPMNRYQSWLRKPLEWKPLVEAFIPKYPRVENSDSRNVQQRRTRYNDEDGDHYALGSDCRIRNWHVTPRFSAKVTERICNIPLKPNADHRHLPKPLRLKNLNTCRNPHDFDGNYGRLGFQGQFNTIITKMHPHNQNKCGAVLHPNQYRTLSLLEAQRAQGFPDRFKLEPAATKGKMDETVNQQLFKLIGNSIPIPISLSLSKSLLKAREQEYLKTKVKEVKKVKRESSSFVLPNHLSQSHSHDQESHQSTKLGADKGKQKIVDDDEIVEISHHQNHHLSGNHTNLGSVNTATTTTTSSSIVSPLQSNSTINNSVDHFQFLKNSTDCLDLLDIILDRYLVPSLASSSS
ncbi:uncharacterized protein PGTG_03742 [Puccinia graminis f. sp. tritici CRL 75-36-700-3]|uniref:DNA (cytosine-5-)-methyltransferase n=2 Tax=Puccinia graminis f. sp. tritici TaxID=56615 RepID=E3K0G1_PUCGT|nr:uncharacterized protein PGTG_03742 [Puccinia graminis f. sp. tritici CRL 75-36-700-3]EFP77786.2 hypothetical protein PGTG_03742 [Puccinia graminis f. sp. tritici CRL 75-36-700-3]